MVGQLRIRMPAIRLREICVNLVLSLYRPSTFLLWETIETRAQIAESGDLYPFLILRVKPFSFTGPGIEKISGSAGAGWRTLCVDHFGFGIADCGFNNKELGDRTQERGEKQ